MCRAGSATFPPEPTTSDFEEENGIPVFAGEETKRILEVIADFTGRPRPKINFGFRDGRSIQLDDIRVTPIGVEHSAKDAYMFLVQADGKNVLYTGDFRASEQAVSAVRGLLGDSGRLDLLITEGTNIRPGKQERAGELRGEAWIAQRAAERMRPCEGTVFVLCSSANEDRIQAISAAAVRRVLDFCKERSVAVEDLHASGHADRETVRALIDGLRPAALLPIHCEAGYREEFLSLHGNCLMPDDGQRWEVA